MRHRENDIRDGEVQATGSTFPETCSEPSIAVCKLNSTTHCYWLALHVKVAGCAAIDSRLLTGSVAPLRRRDLRLCATTNGHSLQARTTTSRQHTAISTLASFIVATNSAILKSWGLLSRRRFCPGSTVCSSVYLSCSLNVGAKCKRRKFGHLT